MTRPSVALARAAMRLSGVPLSSLVFALLAAVGGDELEACVELDRAFDTRGLLAPCTAVADDATRTAADRIAALGILGAAHVINGDEALGERTFLRMLALAPGATVRVDAGARVSAAFERARERFDSEGAVRRQIVRVARVTDDSIEVELELVDPLSRVVAADVVTDGVTPPTALARSDLGRGVVRFVGRAPAPPAAASATVRVRGADDTVVLTEAVMFAATPGSAVAPDAPEDARAFPVVPALVLGAGAVVAVGAAATAIIVEAQLADPKLEADSRALMQWTGRAALAATALGLGVAAVGAALWATDF